MEVSGQLYALAALPQYLPDRRLTGLRSWSGHCGEEKKLFPFPGLEPVTLCLLSYPGSIY
jgi:hypothetical protein